MTSTRRLAATLLVLATIVGVVALQRSRPVQSSPAQFSHLGTATMPFVPNELIIAPVFAFNATRR